MVDPFSIKECMFVCESSSGEEGHCLVVLFMLFLFYLIFFIWKSIKSSLSPAFALVMSSHCSIKYLILISQSFSS